MKVRYKGPTDIVLWDRREILPTSKTFREEHRIVACDKEQVIELCTSRPEQWEPADAEAQAAMSSLPFEVPFEKE